MLSKQLEVGKLKRGMGKLEEEDWGGQSATWAVVSYNDYNYSKGE